MAHARTLLAEDDDLTRYKQIAQVAPTNVTVLIQG